MNLMQPTDFTMPESITSLQFSACILSDLLARLGESKAYTAPLLSTVKCLTAEFVAEHFPFNPQQGWSVSKDPDMKLHTKNFACSYLPLTTAGSVSQLSHRAAQHP